jgi:hypothetical protein
VLTTLGNLYRIYSDAQLEDAVQTKVLTSLEKRWAAADQETFIAAVHQENNGVHFGPLLLWTRPFRPLLLWGGCFQPLSLSD